MSCEQCEEEIVEATRLSLTGEEEGEIVAELHLFCSPVCALHWAEAELEMLKLEQLYRL